MAAKLDVLFVGVGPADGTAPTPLFHITNQRAVEVLRDLGLLDEALALATPNDLMGENTYCSSIAGDELGKLRTSRTQPQRRSDYELASPERICDLPKISLSRYWSAPPCDTVRECASIPSSCDARRTPTE